MIEGDGVALYARVSSDGQARDNTIASQVAALREGVAADGFLLVPDHAYVDEGYSGTILLRPALERLRDAVAGGIVTRIYIHAPDRLARRYAHQVLLIEEFHRAGAEVIFGNCSRPARVGQATLGIGRPWRVRRIASIARTDRRRAVSTTDLMSA